MIYIETLLDQNYIFSYKPIKIVNVFDRIDYKIILLQVFINKHILCRFCIRLFEIFVLLNDLIDRYKCTLGYTLLNGYEQTL